MEEIVKHINDTNASYRTPDAGNAKNTDLFLDNEHYEMFRDAGEQITVRFSKENLSKAILFIASILPRKYDNSATHKLVAYSPEFVFDQLLFIDYYFREDGVPVVFKTQKWNARKDVLKKNGDVDNRFYFNGLLEEVEFVNSKGEHKSDKFTIRNYLAGGYSDIHIKKADDGIFDVWITNVQQPYFDKKEDGLEIIDKDVPKNNSRQIIYYGAPGTGKSHKIKVALGETEDTPEENKVPRENIFRTTFHPDSDYSTFVGAYKPTMKKKYRYDGKVKAKYYEDDDLAGAKRDEIIIDKVIEYDFIPQAFIKAYVRAYQTDENVYLVIEEINRGNCAQIFGDLFQLLDRNEEGKSDYAIKADADLLTYLEEKLGKDNAGIKGGELCLPPNLYIYATMNTSDQSLFPIDSAFKRRWDWEYEPIKYKNTDWLIEIDGNEYSWTSFQKEVNKRIFDDTHSEDKMLGDYFVKSINGVISEKLLLNKILFYLWNDVCKDGDGDIFKTDDNKDIKFSDLYTDNGTDMLLAMMKHLKVEPCEDVADDIDESDAGDPNTLYTINAGEPFKKTYLATKVFQEYVKLFPNQTAIEVWDEWKNKRVEWKNTKIRIPKHLIENIEGYTKYLESSKNDDAKKKNESRFESFAYKGETFYLWKGWGDGVNDNITSFMKAVNESDWGITIKRN